MYPVELEVKDKTESNTSASYLDILLSIGRDGQLHTSIYDKRDDFNFHITNFPFLSSNIPTSPAYGVFISQLIRYARACSSYGCFILRATRLSNKLLEQGYVKERLKSSLRKFNGRYRDLIKQYEVSLSQMLNDILWTDHIQWQPPSDQTLYLTRPFTEFWVVSIENLRRVWHADRGRLLLRTPGPVPFGTCICSTCWDQRHPISIRHYTVFWDIITGLNIIIQNLTFYQILVSVEHLQRVWHTNKGRLLLRTPGPVPLGLVYVLLVETNPFLNLFFRTMLFEYPSVLSRFYFMWM